MFTLRTPERPLFTDLAELRDDALVLSNVLHSRHIFLGIEVCRAEASWRTATGGTAYLTDVTSSLKLSHHNRLPTQLAIYNKAADRLATLVLFRANLEAGNVEVYHHFYKLDSEAAHAAHELGNYRQVETEAKLAGLQQLTTADYHLLQDELYRGASGIYSADSQALQQTDS